jgi:Lon protease-like protein
MFPLGSVLFPGGVLALRIFEPRYVRLIEDLPAHDNRFGVVLIRRGHEVGGGDERYDIGTIAEVVGVDEVGEGLYLLSAEGRDRIRVNRWLDDDPYPVAVIEERPQIGMSEGLRDAVRSAADVRRQLVGVAVEMGADRRQLDVALPDDLERAAWALCDNSPIGPFDRQRLLEIDDPVERLAALEADLVAKVEDLRRVMDG